MHQQSPQQPSLLCKSPWQHTLGCREPWGVGKRTISMATMNNDNKEWWKQTPERIINIVCRLMEEGYFVFDEGMSKVARAVADDQPDKSGLQQLLLGAQSCKHLNARVFFLWVMVVLNSCVKSWSCYLKDCSFMLKAPVCQGGGCRPGTLQVKIWVELTTNRGKTKKPANEAERCASQAAKGCVRVNGTPNSFLNNQFNSQKDILYFKVAS